MASASTTKNPLPVSANVVPVGLREKMARLRQAEPRCVYHLSLTDMMNAEPSKDLVDIESKQARIETPLEWKLWQKPVRQRLLRRLTQELGAGTALLFPYLFGFGSVIFIVMLLSQWVASVYRYEANTVTKPCILKELNLTGGSKCPFANPQAFAGSAAVLKRVLSNDENWEDAITAYQYQPVPWMVVLINVPIGLAILVFALLIDRFMMVKAKRLERRAIGPSAFACHLQGFPKDAAKTTKEKVRKFAEQWGEVDKVIVCKDDGDLPDFQFRLQVIDEEIERIHLMSGYTADPPFVEFLKRMAKLADVTRASPFRWISLIRATWAPTTHVAVLERERAKITKEMAKMRAKLRKSYKFTGDAFVIYTRPTDAEDVDLSIGILSHKVMSLFYPFQSCMRPKFLFDGEYPIISWPCPEPHELKWLNIKYSWKQRIGFRFLGLFKLWGYLLSGVIISLAGNSIIRAVGDDSWFGRILSHIVSIFITLVVFFARRGVKNLATEEAHLTKTSERASAAQNFVLLSIALNVGCSGLPFLPVPRRWIDPRVGLVDQVTRQVLFAGAVDPVVELFKGLARRRVSKTLAKKATNQLQLRNAYIKPSIEVEDVITHIAQLFAVALAFFPAIPLSMTYAFIALIVFGLITILRFFKLNSKPSYTTSVIFRPALVVSLFVVFVYAASVALVFILYRPGDSWLGAIIAALFFVLIAVSLISPWPYALAAVFQLALTCANDSEPKRAPSALFCKTAPIPGKPGHFIPGTAYRQSYRASRGFKTMEEPSWSACTLYADPVKEHYNRTAASVQTFITANPQVRVTWEVMTPMIENNDDADSSDSDSTDSIALDESADGWDTVSSGDEEARAKAGRAV